MLVAAKTTRTEPTVEPLSIEDACEHLRIDYRDHDDMIAGLITSARKWLEEAVLWRCLITQTCVDCFDRFADPMRLHWSPVSSITSIAYLDTNGASQTLSTDVYELGTVYGVPVVRLKYGQAFPATRSHADVVTVTYAAGYGAASSNVPRPIRDALKLQLQQLYDVHDDARARTVEALCGPFVGEHLL